MSNKTEKELSELMHEIAVEHCQTRQKPYISILQPRRNFKETPAQQLQSWQNRMVDMTSVAVSFHGIDQNPVDAARCYLIEKALEDDAKYALFVDEDTALPYYGVRNLIATSEKYPDAIICGIYYVKFGNVMMSVLDECDRWVLPDVTPNSGVVRNIMSTGLGCALIPMHIIKKMKAEYGDNMPLFCIVPEKTWGDDKVTFMGEDTWFYALAKKMGIETIGDTSVQCLHMELFSGKYESHPDVVLEDYLTNIPITTPLTMADRNRVSKDYNDRICKVAIPLEDLSGKSLEDIYNDRCNKIGAGSVNLDEHMPTLLEYAKQCKHITEMGVQFGTSTYALMLGKPKKMVSYDIEELSVFGVDETNLIKLGKENGVNYKFIKADTREVSIDKTDLLFIDTYHSYKQLSKEFQLHAGKVSKYIILHDIVSYGQQGEDGGGGLILAIDEFLASNTDWTVDKVFQNNNGLMILKRN